MDLFDNINNKSRISTKEFVSYEIKSGKGISKLLFDFEDSCTFKHGDKLTNLIKARILENYQKGNTISPDNAKYICFEIPTFMSLEELIKNNIFNTLEKIGEFENLVYGEYNHIGIIYRSNNENYELYSPTEEVLQYVKENLNEQIRKSEKLFSERLKGKEFKKRISETANEYIKQKEKIKSARKNNIFLEEQYRYKIGEEIYTDYIGTDVTEGKILRINRLSKIDDGQKEKLYSAFIEKKDEEEEQEETIVIGEIPKGFPILFKLPHSLEEYIQNNDEKEITKILQLITDLPKERLNINEMIYIGEIDTQGNIHRNIDNCSEELKQKIAEKQLKYKETRSKKQLSRI